MPSRRRASADARRVPRRPTKRDVEGAFDFEPHRCFACGELNEHGLHLGIHTDPGGSWTETTLEPRFQGWEAVAHGGIVCTLLDEVMAWAVIGRGTWGVTARLNVTFRRPIPVGRAIRAEGWVVDENRRAHRAEGRVIDAGTGEILATGESTFVAVPPTEVERLKARYGMRRLANQPDITGATDRSDQESSGDTDQTGAAGGAEARPGARGRDVMSPWTAAAGTTAGEHAAAILNEREGRAAELGIALAEQVGDPAAFAKALHDAFVELADPEYRAGQAFVAPGIGPTHGVRTPLQVGVRRAFEKASRRASPAELLLVCDRLLREPEREARWFAISTLQRTLPAEPERTWQLLRRAAAAADDWITVDDLAHPYGKGILAEPYRWAELEQLTVSPSRWERRLVGSTIATMPFVNRRLGRAPEVPEHALPLLATLIGDADPDVQKALSWAYRSMAMVDPAATTSALETEAATAAAKDDGHRAWVIRDSLSKLEPARAARLRAELGSVRRKAGAPATSAAAELALRFADMGLGRRMPEPPLT